MSIYIASFDIGKKAFAFCIEKVNRKVLDTIQNIPKTKRWNQDGTPTDQFTPILDSVYSSGELTLLKVKDISIGTDMKKYIDPEIFFNMNELLDRYKKYWDLCDYIVIEQQMGFNRNYNTMALKLGQHCFSYFVTKYTREKQIIEFPAYHKTNILGSQKILKKTKTGKTMYRNIDKPARKKWCVEKAKEILFDRDDMTNLSKIQSAKKKDDLSDVICQLQAF